MEASIQIGANLKQVVPFLGVTDMERSVRFYIDGLGFAMKHQWVPEGKLRWCWLTRGGASLMLQEFVKEGHGGVNGPRAFWARVSRCASSAKTRWRSIASFAPVESKPMSPSSAIRCG